jgi:Sulfotransferase family
MIEKLPVFHIGANKAGSTTLQQALFAQHPEVLNIGKPDFAPQIWPAIDAIRDACNRRNSILSGFAPEKFKAAWQDRIASAAGRVPVVSYEELIRSYFYGEPDPARLPKAITEIAGPVRVVIVTRHQLKLIESLYIHKNNTTNYMAPSQWLESQPDWFAYGYRFHEIADAWAGIVGEKNVGVFMFEELVNDAASFARRLCSFIDIDVSIGTRLLCDRHENVRKSHRTQAYVRLRSHFLPRRSLGRLLPVSVREMWRGYLEGGARSHVAVPPDWLRRIEEYYKVDNRMLAQRFHLPLQDFGYPL